MYCFNFFLIALWMFGKEEKVEVPWRQKMQLFVAKIRSNIFIQFWDCHVVEENVKKVPEKALSTYVGGENWFCWSALKNWLHQTCMMWQIQPSEFQMLMEL